MQIADTINDVTLVGPLGRDAIRRVTKNGVAVINFPLITKHKWKNAAGDDVESSTWHQVALPGDGQARIAQGI